MKKGQILPDQRKKLREESGYYSLLISFRQSKESKHTKKAAVHTVECGCGCKNRLEVHDAANLVGLEIGGVEASIESWRKVLLPLLAIEETETGFEDTHPILSLRKKYNPSGEKR